LFAVIESLIFRQFLQIITNWKSPNPWEEPWLDGFHVILEMLPIPEWEFPLSKWAELSYSTHRHWLTI
jgi:hypothetical protein